MMTQQASLAAYEAWCAMRRARAFPVTPALLAQFVAEHAASPIEALTSAVSHIAEFDMAHGLANPAATPAVERALSAVAAIAPPRSWPKAEAARFEALPFALKRYVARREQERDRELRRAQNQAADLRKRCGATETGSAAEAGEG